jgi:hypothetical protein
VNPRGQRQNASNGARTRFGIGRYASVSAGQTGGKEAVMGLKDMLADGVRVGPDDVIDIGAVRDAAGNYRRGTTTLREIANLVLDELAARGVPIPPAPPKAAREPAPELEVGVTPLVARVLERHRRVLPTDETICEMFGIAQRQR